MRFLLVLLGLSLFFACQKEAVQETPQITQIESTEVTTELSDELIQSIKAQGPGTYAVIDGQIAPYAEELRAEARSAPCNYTVRGRLGTNGSTGDSFYLVFNVRFPGDVIVTYAPPGATVTINVNFTLHNCESRSIPASYNGFGGLKLEVVQTSGAGTPPQVFAVGPSRSRVFDNTAYRLRCITNKLDCI